MPYLELAIIIFQSEYTLLIRSFSNVIVNMARSYSNEEYLDMHFIYDKADSNVLEAMSLYQEMFLHLRHRNSRTSQGYINASEIMGALYQMHNM